MQPAEAGDAGRGGFCRASETIMRAGDEPHYEPGIMAVVIKSVGLEKIFPYLNKVSPSNISPKEQAVQWLQESLSVTNIADRA